MSTVMRNIFLSAVLFTFFCLAAQAQAIPYMERTVSLSAVDQPIAEVLKSISEQTSVVFSYTQFNDQKRISINCYKKPLRIALSEILSTSNCMYKSKDKYVIIKCSESPEPLVNSIISGYIYNAADSSKIDRASVYIPANRRSSLTNEYGYFFISITETSPKIQLSVAKQNYYDTTVVLYNPKECSVVIYLHPKPVIKETNFVPEPVKSEPFATAKRDTVIAETPDYLKKFRSKFKNASSNFKNITDTLFSGFSVSLIPPISTNRLLSVNTVNRFSLNLLAGYSKGLNGMEIGGIVNIDGGDAKYFQIAGIGNIVSGNFSGFQTGGIFNINHQSTNGMQVGGIYNRTRKLKGWQISGLINNADTVKGSQLAGFINDADLVQGVQIAGFINNARKVQGVQLAVFNFSDTCSGAPIGFFSFVNKGYHKIGLEVDELSFGTLSFGTGSDYFHNIFLGGINLFHRDIWSYGYGIGTGYEFSKKWNLAVDGTSRQLQSADYSQIRLNLLNRFFLGVEFSPHSKIRVGIGPSYNVMVADVTGDNYFPVSKVLPSAFMYNQTNGDINVKMWIGGTLSVKFL